MKPIQKLKAIAIAFLISFILIGCKENTITVTNIMVDETSILETFDVSDFSIYNLKLIVTYSDKTEEKIPVTSSMVSSADLEKLYYMGTHTITINYLGFETTVTIHFSDRNTTNLLTSYYEYAVLSLNYTDTFDNWVKSVTNNNTLTILKAHIMSNEVILTLSNNQTLNLGTIGYQVSFYAKDEELLASYVVPIDQSATAPAAPFVLDYEFTGWSSSYKNVRSNLEIQALYKYISWDSFNNNQVDELNISLDRLKNAQFEIDLSSIFDGQTQNNRAPRSRSLLSILLQATAMNLDDPFNPSDYISHTYWPTMYYHRGLYEMAEIIDGYHVITSQVTTYANNTINNLITSTSMVTSIARENADWAVDNITVVDTWVVNANTKYFLHYNKELDRVEYYFMVNYSDESTSGWYEKIFIYYNSKGEEVIERWTEHRFVGADDDGYYGTLGYYNSVSGRDFNFYFMWLNSDYEPTSARDFRGINLNEDGIYEYYQQDAHMISGAYGWYEMRPRINDNDQLISYADDTPFFVYSPDGSTNVFEFYRLYDSYYVVDLYLPAMDGVNSILVEEGGMFEINQDTEEVRSWMINRGLDIMPNRWEMDLGNMDISTGFKTNLGTFISDPGNYVNNVSLERVNVQIFAEGVREYQFYHNYCGIVRLHVNVNNIDDMLDAVFAYMNSSGMSYEYGDINNLFEELKYVYLNRATIGGSIDLMNPLMQGPIDAFKNYENRAQSHIFIENYLKLHSEFEKMVVDYSEIKYENRPPVGDINKITFINTFTEFTGKLNVENSIMSTNEIVAMLNRSPLLQNQQFYTLYYALLIGGKVVVIGHEEPKQYQGNGFIFEGNTALEIPKNLMEGEYQLVTFFGKVSGDNHIRISDVVYLPVNVFESTNFLIVDDESEIAYYAYLNYVANSMNVTVDYIDLFAPKVYFLNDEITYQKDQAIKQLSVPDDSTVEDLLNLVGVHDNMDKTIKLTLTNITKNNEPVQLKDPLIGSNWKIKVSDKSNNVTTITISIISNCLNVDEEMYE